MDFSKLRYITELDENALSMILLSALKKIFFLADLLLNFICGYSLKDGSRKERERSKEFEHSAQEVTILYRGTYSIFFSMGLENYLYYHVKYTTPNVILENDDIILSGITPTHAYFSLTCHPDNNVLNLNICPFLGVGQFLKSEKLVIIPMETLHKLANKLGDPNDRDVIVLDNSGRCGSTLLCQMMSKVPNIRCLSEPWALVHSYEQHKTYETTLVELKHVVQSVVRLQCKPEHGKRVDKLFIKLSFFSVYLHPVIKKLFPKFKFIFLTRHSRDFLTSFFKIFITRPRYFDRTPMWGQYFRKFISFPQEDKKWWQERAEIFRRNIDSNTKVHALAIVHSGVMCSFMHNRKNYFKVLFYEDFIGGFVEETRKLLNILDINQMHVPQMMTALESDSQRGIGGGIGNDGISITRPTWIELDDLMERCGYPVTSRTTLDEFKQIMTPPNMS